MKTFELPSDTSVISAEIFQHPDGTFGYTVKDGDMAILDLHRDGPFRSVTACEEAARTRIEHHRQDRVRRAAARSAVLDRTHVKTVL